MTVARPGRLLASLLVAAVFTVTRHALAETRVVTVDLEVDAAERPAHVCVLHETPFDEAKLFGNMFEQGSRVRSMGDVIEDTDGDERVSESWSGRRPRPPPVATPTTGVAPTLKNEGETARNLRLAFEALMSSGYASGNVCGAGAAPHASAAATPLIPEERRRRERIDACAPRFTLSSIEIPPKRFIRCVPNSVSVAQPARVLVLDAAFPAAANWRRLNLVSLVGSVVTLRFDGERGAPRTVGSMPDELGVVVVGGHYVEGFGRSALGDRVQLQLVPRCHLREVRPPEPIPSVANRHIKLSICTAGRRVTCRRKLDEPLILMIPDTIGGQRSTLKMSIVDEPPFDADGYAEEECRPHTPPNALASFEARWTSRAPPTELLLKPVRVEFQWQPGCSYPFRKEQLCPSARLKDHGLACGMGVWNTKDETCVYECPKEGSDVFAFPTAIEFAVKDKELVWTDALHHANETLTSSPGGERQFYLDLSRWGSEAGIKSIRQRAVDRVPQIEIDVPGGGTHRFQPQEGLITLPGASCGALLRYRFVGDRAYTERDVPIQQGRIELTPPKETGRLFTFSGALGGGLMVPTEAHPFDTGVVTPRPYAGVHVSGRWRYRSEGRFSIEARASYAFAEQPYGPLHTAENIKSRDIPLAPYSRFFLSLRPVVTLVRLADRELDIIPDVGTIGFGRPLLERDSTNVGETIVFWSPSLSVRWHVFRWGFLELGARWIFKERLYSYKTDFTATPIRTEHTLGQFMIDIAVGASIF